MARKKSNKKVVEDIKKKVISPNDYIEMREYNFRKKELQYGMNECQKDILLFEKEKLLIDAKIAEIRNKFSDLRQKFTGNDNEYKTLLNKIERELGIEMKDVSINPETFEIIEEVREV